MTDDELLQLIRDQSRDNRSGWASRHDISATYLADILNKRSRIPERVARQMGYRKWVTWEKVDDT